MKWQHSILCGLAMGLSACLPVTPTSVPANNLTPEADPSPTPTGAVIETPTTAPQVVELIVWVAPQFSPDPSTAAGRILAERLAEFETNYSNIEVRVRTKAAQGPGNILAALSSAAKIGPQAMPDLVTLDPQGLAEAKRLELIQPVEPNLSELLEQDLYPFAVQATLFEDRAYGIPFGSDTDFFAYRSGLYPSAPESWLDLLESSSSFLFAAGDPQAGFTMAQYLALDGKFTDAEGNPILDPGILSTVLSFYNSAEFAGRLPLYALQYASPADTWSALQDKRSASAEAPLGSFLNQADGESESAVPIPTRDGAGIALSDTWMFSVTSDNPLRMQATKALLNWLLEPEFLGSWSRSLGMIPGNPGALDYWPEADAALVRPLASVARPIPDREILALFGPMLQIAVEDVLVGNATPEEAALDALRSLDEP